MEQPRIYTAQEIQTIVAQLHEKMNDCAVFTFTGSLGAGKTTLIQALLRSCGVRGPITSPTFTYINQYENERGEKFYHFDLYRIKSIDDFIASGFDEYLYQPKSWCFIEWPEIIKPLLTHKVCHVSLEYHDEFHRLIMFDIIV